MSNEELLAVVEMIQAHLQDVRGVVQNSLSLRAVGGDYIINELFAIEPQMESVKEAVEAIIAAQPIA